ncbi:MAG TPA: hypothetical protein VNU95_15325, partial [Candidatus Acidoferrales bacterium]|nr:hypothetical protein [Candidatus Acidoferrales bacterium]
GDWAPAKVEEIKMAAQEEIQNAQPAIEQAKTTAQKIVAKYAPKGAAPQPPKIPAPPPTIRPHKGWKQ